MSFWHRFLVYIVPHENNAYRPHMLRRNWLLFFLALVLATEGFLIASIVARQSGGSFLAAVISADIISLTNSERLANNAPSLSENELLNAAAQAKAEDMAGTGYFSHVGPDGRQPWEWIEAAGYDYQYAGENLAVRFVDSKDVVSAWMASPSHRANLIKGAYREIGIGVAHGTYKGTPATFVVQYFGTPAGHVLGAGDARIQAGPLESAVRALPKLASNPRENSTLLLSGVAALIMVLISLSFFIRVQVQATELLLPGVAVAAVAVFFIALNSTFLSAGSQPASVLLGGPSTVVIDTGSASVSR